MSEACQQVLAAGFLLAQPYPRGRPGTPGGPSVRPPTLAGEGLGSDFCHKARSPKENAEYVNFILRVKVALLLC